MNLETVFPSLPAVVANYRQLCLILKDDVHIGTNGRAGHLAYMRQFFEFQPVFSATGHKTHKILVTKILNSEYVKWVSSRRRWSYDSALVLGHYLTLSLEGRGPNPPSKDTKTFVATTSNLFALLNMANPNIGQWRKGALELDVEPAEQIAQHNIFHSHLRKVILTIITSQLIVRQFVINRNWIVFVETSAASQWRFASDKEAEYIKGLSDELLKKFEVESFSHLFVRRLDEEFFAELNKQITAKLPEITKAWRVWHIAAGTEFSTEDSVLSLQDQTDLAIALNAASCEWAIGASIDSEIIDAAIEGRRIIGQSICFRSLPMFYAQIESDPRVRPTPGETRAVCPLCRAPVIPKCGAIKIHHWAHVRAECDSWSEPESAWHLGWKSRFPAHQVEVCFGPHRADVATDLRVIELQHSAISPADIAAREEFYGAARPRGMVWLLDATEIYDRMTLEQKKDFVKFRWPRCPARWFGATAPICLDFGGGVLVIKKWSAFKSSMYGWGYLATPETFVESFGG